MNIALALVFAAAVAVWAFAVWQVFQVVRVVKSGQRFSLFFPGWPWNVEKAVARYGPQIEAPLRAFQRTFLLFFGLVFMVAAAAIFLAAGSNQ
ncbi:MAG: hypothetical protein KF849_10815 [Rhizobiaceae bacterium]|nr:hypothetical protein [Rhizobiaceae bacterium]